MSDLNEVLPCILYDKKVKHGDYDMVKVKVKMDNGTFRKCTLPHFAGDKGGVEGLFYMYNEFMTTNNWHSGWFRLTSTNLCPKNKLTVLCDHVVIEGVPNVAMVQNLHRMNT